MNNRQANCYKYGMNEKDPYLEALKRLCDREGGYKSVADKAGVNDQTLYQIIAGVRLPSGNPRGVGPQLRKKLTAAYPGWLSAVGETVAGPKMGGRVPLISNVQAGDFKEHVDNFHPGDGGAELIPTTVPVRRHTFALRVSGDSMEPEFPEGMILIIEPELEPVPGDYVVAKNGSEETTFKQLIKDGGDWYLKPLNPRYPIKPLGNSQIIGVLRAVEKRYR